MTTMKAFIKQHPVLTYYILTFAISWGSGLIVLGPGRFVGIMEPSRALFLLAILVGIMGPCLSGLLLTGLVDGRAGFYELRTRLFDRRVGAGWYAAAILIGPLTMVAALFALSPFFPVILPRISLSTDTAFLLVMSIVAGLVVGCCEELGWTGFAIPRLRERHGILATGLLVGILWGVWHFPVFSGQANASESVPMALYLSVLLFSFLPPFRVLLVWVHDRTGSLLVVMLMHASLSASSLIFQPQGTGVQVIALDLLHAAFLWLLVAGVALASSGRLSRRALERRAAH